MTLHYMQRGSLPLSLRASQLLLILMLLAVPPAWYMATEVVRWYFSISTASFDPLRSQGMTTSNMLATLPQVALMTGASIGGTLAAMNWRVGARARVLLTLHVVVYVISTYFLYNQFNP
jgi:hypothetical protein